MKIFLLICIFLILIQDVYGTVKVGLVVSAYNRPDYLSTTLNGLREKRFGSNFELELLIVDDSSDEEARSLIDTFWLPDILVIRARLPKNSGIDKVLSFGWNILAARGCDYLCNLDSDVLLKDDWLEILLNTYLKAKETLNNPDLIVTGYNSRLHPILSDHQDFYIKESCGGINLFYPVSSLPLIQQSLDEGQDWDSAMVWLLSQFNYSLICTKPSIVQHIGRFGMNNEGSFEEFAEDFILDEGHWARFCIPTEFNYPLVCTKPSVVHHIGHFEMNNDGF